MKQAKIYFDYVSPFPYFLNEFILKNEIESRYEIRFDWIPVFLGGLWPNNNNMPSNASDTRKMNYLGYETKRYAEELGIPHAGNFFKPIPVLRTAIAAKRQGLFEPYHTQLYRRLQGQGQTPDNDLFADIIKSVGGNPEQLLQDVNSPEVKQELIANGEEAIKQEVFGVPFVIYEQKPYWGYNHFPYLLKELGEPKG
jgi:2-hydroxychromene-2-carboxylate isomerase